MVNTAYLRTAAGILKIVEVILAIICLICSAVHGAVSFAGYLTFAAVITLVVELILFFVYLFDVNASVNAPWTLIDTIWFAFSQESVVCNLFDGAPTCPGLRIHFLSCRLVDSFGFIFRSAVTLVSMKTEIFRY
nr:unnamed protein product [Spirometra erinaceieuropaei]